MKESYSDFSIIKKYLELKEKYDNEIKQYAENGRAREEQFKKQTALLEQEVAKRNEYIKAQEQKIKDLTQKMAEKDNQLKTMGLQLHKLKMAQNGGAQPGAPQADAEDKKRKRGLF